MPAEFRFESVPVVLRALLALGVASPFLYYGTQLAAAPFFHGYDFVRQAASILGSDLATHPMIFNVGAMLTGVALIAGGVGLGVGLRRLGTHAALAIPPALSAIINGAVAINAGIFPLPDPRHAAHPALMVPVLIFPLLAAIAIWRHPDAGRLRWYFVATLLLIGAIAPIMAGATPIDRSQYEGLLQRIATLLMFPPVAVVAWFVGWGARARAATRPA